MIGFDVGLDKTINPLVDFRLGQIFVLGTGHAHLGDRHRTLRYNIII